MIYAIYRGDEFIYVGDLIECSQFMNVKPNTIKHLSTKSHHKRTSDRAIKVYKYRSDGD